MKRILTTLILVSLLSAIGFAKVPADRYLIEGKLKNIPDSTQIVLYLFQNGIYKPVATDTLKRGRFSFSDTIGRESQQFFLSPNGKGFSNVSLEVWAVRGQKTEVRGADNLVATWKVKSKDPRQKEVERYRLAQEPEYTRILIYGVDEMEIIRHFFVDLKGDDKYNEQFNNQLDSIRRLKQPLDAAADLKLMDFMLTAPVTDLWLQKYFYFVKRYRKGKESEEFNNWVVSLMPRMSEADPKAEYAVAINDMLSAGQAAKVGDDMVDGVLYDAAGARHTLSELKGQYMLLDFWSQGCGPCRASLPELEELIKRYEGRLVVVGICTDDKDAWKTFLKEHNPGGLQWNQLLPYGSGLVPRYGVTGIPHYVLISPEGKIVLSWAGYGKGVLIGNISKVLDSED